MTTSRYLNLVVEDAHPSRASVDDDPTGTCLPSVPVECLSLAPHEVEHGDILVGLTVPVDSILTDGTFWFYGCAGVFIAKRPSWGRVQVWRQVPS